VGLGYASTAADISLSQSSAPASSPASTGSHTFFKGSVAADPASPAEASMLSTDLIGIDAR